MISDKNKKLLRKLAAGLISQKAFDKSFKKKFNLNEIDLLLNESLGNNSLFHMYFWYCPKNLNYTEKDILFKKYISINEGHHEHEEMLSYFHRNFINPIGNIDILTKLIEQPPHYFFAEGRQMVFIDKCIFTIAQQPQPFNLEALEELAKSEDEKIKDLALHQIEKRKQYRRWENEKD